MTVPLKSHFESFLPLAVRPYLRTYLVPDIPLRWRCLRTLILARHSIAPGSTSYHCSASAQTPQGRTKLKAPPQLSQFVMASNLSLGWYERPRGQAADAASTLCQVRLALSSWSLIEVSEETSAETKAIYSTEIEREGWAFSVCNTWLLK